MARRVAHCRAKNIPITAVCVGGAQHNTLQSAPAHRDRALRTTHAPSTRACTLLYAYIPRQCAPCSWRRSGGLCASPEATWRRSACAPPARGSGAAEREIRICVVPVSFFPVGASFLPAVAGLSLLAGKVGECVAGWLRALSFPGIGFGGVVGAPGVHGRTRACL